MHLKCNFIIGAFAPMSHENGIHQFTTDVTEKEHELPKKNMSMQ
jgi:hypothetical protein